MQFNIKIQTKTLESAGVSTFKNQFQITIPDNEEKSSVASSQYLQFHSAAAVDS